MLSGGGSAARHATATATATAQHKAREGHELRDHQGRHRIFAISE